MKHISEFILLLLFPLMVSGQMNPFYVPQEILNRDSLLSIIEESTDDVVQMNAYRELGFIYYENKRDSALFFFEKVIILAKENDRKLWEADASNSIGFISYVQGNYPRSLQFLLQAKRIAEDPESEKNTWSPSDQRMVSPHTARISILVRSHNHLGSLYGFTGNFTDNVALEFFHLNESLRLAESIQDKRLQSIATMNIARHYAYVKNLDSALHYGNRALTLFQESNYTRYKGAALSNIGYAYTLQKQYELAKQAYWKAVRASQQINNLRSLGDSYLALSNLHRVSGASDSSLYYGQKALLNYRITTIPRGMADAYASLSATYELRNKIDSAFRYQGLALKLRENLSAEDKIKQFQNMSFDERLRVQQLEKDKDELQNRIMTYALLSGIAAFMLIAFILLRNNRIRKKANTLLQQQKDKVETTLGELRSTQSQLIQSEKMASLGELTAGIAHEIQNPLNFVNNFSEVSNELLDEMKSELASGNLQPATEIANDVKQNLEKILHHGKRADAIVKGMLQHSRSSSGVKEPTDINTLADEYLRLAYHGLRAKDKSFNATMNRDFDPTIGNIQVIPQDIGRVILNLITNALYAVSEKKSAFAKATADEGNKYEPTVTVSTKRVGSPLGLPAEASAKAGAGGAGGGMDKIEIRVTDNGNGIPSSIKDKIFQPFFTTKPTGQGTGLGLSLSYDIVKAHGGELKVETKEGEGSEFVISLSLKNQ